MTLANLFSFDGRMRRSHFWLARLGGLVAFIGVFMLLLLIGSLVGAATGAGNPSLRQDALPASAPNAAMLGFSLLSLLCTFAALVAYGWLEVAILIKRWHDRDRPGGGAADPVHPADRRSVDPGRVWLPGRHAGAEHVRPIAQA